MRIARQPQAFVAVIAVGTESGIALRFRGSYCELSRDYAGFGGLKIWPIGISFGERVFDRNCFDRHSRRRISYRKILTWRKADKPSQAKLIFFKLVGDSYELLLALLQLYL